MKILHVSPCYVPATRYGGLISAVHGLAKAQAELGHRVSVLTTNLDGRSRSDVPMAEAVVRDGVEVRYFDSPWARRIFWAPKMRGALSQALGQCDILHVHSLFVWPVTAAAAMARRMGVPYVVSPHGMLVESLFRAKSPVIKRLWLAAVGRRFLQGSAAVHFTSHLEQREAEAFCLGLRAAFVTPFGVEMVPGDPAGWQSVSAAAHREVDLPVLFLGRIHWKKGVDRLIEAMVRVPEVELIVAGPDEEGYEKRMRALAESRGVAARIRWLGLLESEAKQRALEAAAVVALPSRSENFGMVVLEALAAGRAVLVTPEVGAAEIVERAAAGVVVEGGVEPIAEALRNLSRNREGLLEMGRRGREAVRRSFGWDRIAERFVSQYEAIATTSRGGR